MSEILADGILWVAATPRELACVPATAPGRRLVTGCGPAAAAAVLALDLGRAPTPSLVVGVGVAGAYPGAGAEVGMVVRVDVDGFCDLGAQDGEGFLELWDMGFPDTGVERRFRLAAPGFLERLDSVAGTTCSTCTGSESTSRARRLRTGAAVETMEGAAWALACGRAGVPLAQVRSISNLAGPRDRAAWKLQEALSALERALEESCRSI